MTEYEKFLAYLKSRNPKITGVTENNYKLLPSYQTWVAMGRPLTSSSIESVPTRPDILGGLGDLLNSVGNIPLGGMNQAPPTSWNPPVSTAPNYGGHDINTDMLINNAVNPNWNAPITLKPAGSKHAAGELDVVIKTLSDGKQHKLAGTYDVNGVFNAEKDLGEVESGGMTPYQQEQIKMGWAQESRLGNQAAVEAERNRLTRNTNQWQQFANERGRSEDQIRAEERSKMAQQYESWRNTLLGELTSSRDWITKWQVGQKPNPYTPKQFSPGIEAKNNLAQAQQEDKNARAALLDWTKRANDNTEEVDPKIIAAAVHRVNLANRHRQEADYQAEAWKYSEDYQKAQPQPSGNGNSTVGSGASKNKPTGPAVPYWMPSFVPQTAGQTTLTPKMKYEVAPPSGQSWNATPTSVKQGLAGYMDFAGQDYADLLDQMNMRKTATPGIAAGWRPTRQR